MLKNLATYSASSVTTLFMFLLLILAGRYLGAEDFGRFSLAMAVAFLFDPIMDPGIYHYLIREIAREPKAGDHYVAHALTWKLLVAAPTFLLIFATVNAMHDSPKTLWAVYLMAIAAFLKSFKDALRSVLIAHESFGKDALSLFIERSSLLVFGALVLYLNQGLIALCIVFVSVRVIDLAIIATMVRRRGIPVRIGRDMEFLRRMIGAAVPIGAVYITLNVYNYVDTVMLSLFRQEAEVGWYGASYRIYEGLLIIPGIIATVFMPRLSRLFKESEVDCQALFAKGMKYLFLLALAVSVNGALLSQLFVPLFFGPEFVPSIESMNILFLSVPFVFCLNFLQMSMISMDRQKVVFYTTVFGLFANVCLNVVLIPWIGYLGAAASTAIVEGCLLIGLVGYLRRTALRMEVWNIYGKAALVMAAACVPVFLLFPSAHVGVRVGMVNAAFAGLLFWFKILGESEIEAVSALIRRPRPEAIGFL